MIFSYLVKNTMLYQNVLGGLLGCHALKNLFLLILVLYFAGNVQAQYEDLRCKCTCLSYPKYNLSAQIYTSGVESRECNCLYIVVPVLNGSVINKGDLEPYCLRCECKYEVRSTKTMQVVVCIFIFLIGVLVTYMVFMLVADPIMNAVKAHHEPLQEDGTEMSSLPRNSLSSQSIAERKSFSVFQRVNLVQSKWKKQVRDQRSSVFERQEMLQ